MRLRPRCTGHEHYARHLQIRIANDAENANADFLLNAFRQGLETHSRKREEVRRCRALILFPVERVRHAAQNAVRLPRVPVIVKSPNDELMFFYECFLIAPHCVICRFEHGSFVFVTIEGWLVSDDQVQVLSSRALQDVERSHHAGCDACNRRVGISRLECIDSLGIPRNTGVLLYKRDDLAGADAVRMLSTRDTRNDKRENCFDFQVSMLYRFRTGFGSRVVAPAIE